MPVAFFMAADHIFVREKLETRCTQYARVWRQERVIFARLAPNAVARTEVIESFVRIASRDTF